MVMHGPGALKFGRFEAAYFDVQKIVVGPFGPPPRSRSVPIPSRSQKAWLAVLPWQRQRKAAVSAAQVLGGL